MQLNMPKKIENPVMLERGFGGFFNVLFTLLELMSEAIYMKYN